MDNKKKMACIAMIISLVIPLTIIGQVNQTQLAKNRQTPSGIDEKKYKIIEGDIMVPVDDQGVRITATWETKFWPNGIVPFEFDANVTTQNQQLMLDAMAEWERVANLDFRPRNNDDYYIYIQNSNINSSSVGRQPLNFQPQIVNIFNWSWRYIIAHELGHALGYWHEQSRPDRDDSITVHIANIESGKEGNFDKHEQAGHYGPYDFDSVMHYDQYAFSICTPTDVANKTCTKALPTITVLPPSDTVWQSRIGQRNHLSRLDTLTMSFLYPEDNWRFVDAVNGGFPPTSFGQFLSPLATLNAGVFFCPPGGTLWIQPGTYNEAIIINQSMTLKAPLGGVTISAAQAPALETGGLR